MEGADESTELWLLPYHPSFDVKISLLFLKPIWRRRATFCTEESDLSRDGSKTSLKMWRLNFYTFLIDFKIFT